MPPESRSVITGALPPARQARYEQAWLACRVVAEQVGEQALVEAYDAATAGTPVTGALAGAGLPLPDLTRLWRTRLQDLAG